MKAARGCLLLLFLTPLSPTSGQSKFLTAEDVVSMPSPPPDKVISYGREPLQFGQLRLPQGAGPHPVAIVIHGGCWLSRYRIDHIGNLAQALTGVGFASWAIEYRSVGDRGGGWPGTFQDVARGADYVRELARTYPLDLSRVLAVGHSAGGHLALWLAGRHRIAADSPLFSENPLPLRGVLGLAAASDLALVEQQGSCDHVMDKFMGGSPSQFPRRYQQGSPVELAPLGVPQVLVNGAHDSWSLVANSYYRAASKAGDPIRRIIAPDSAHFEMIVPTTSTWSLVQNAALSLLNPDPEKE
ncbi:MAG: alpha/beta hydrolase family protein [Acidobacteriota bacterium]